MNITDSIVTKYSGWDDAGEKGDIFLYDAVLAIDTKNFKKGSTVESICFMFSTSKVEIYATAGPENDGVTPMKVVESFDIKLVPNFA